jgi:hypothetical protein
MPITVVQSIITGKPQNIVSDHLQCTNSPATARTLAGVSSRLSLSLASSDLDQMATIKSLTKGVLTRV